MTQSTPITRGAVTSKAGPSQLRWWQGLRKGGSNEALRFKSNRRDERLDLELAGQDCLIVGIGRIGRHERLDRPVQMAERLALIEAVDSTSPLSATTIINLPIDRIGQYHVRAIVREFRSREVLRFIDVSPSAFS